MKTTQTQQWLYLLLFTLAGVAVFGLFYLMATLFIPPAADVRDYYASVVDFVEERIPGQAPAVLPPAGEVYKDFYGLPVNETIRIDNYRVIYRGLEPEGRFNLAVANMQLDPDTFYTYSFNIAETDGVIHIASRRFQVLSARATILHLKRAAQ